MKSLFRFGFSFIHKFWYIVYFSLCSISATVTVFVTWIMGQIIDILTIGSSYDKLFAIVVVFFSVSLLGKIIQVLLNHVYLRLESYAGYDSNKDLIKRIYNTSYANVCGEDPAMLNQKINNDSNAVTAFCITFFKDVVYNIIIIVMIVIILILEAPVMVGVFGLLVLLYTSLYIFAQKKLFSVSLKVKELQTKFFAGLYDMVSSMKSIRNNGFKEKVMEDQDEVFGAYYRSMKKRIEVFNAYDVAKDGISLLAQVFLFLYGGLLVLSGKLGLGVLIVIMNYFSYLIQSTDFFLDLGKSLQDAMASYHRLVPYLKMRTIIYGTKRIDHVNHIEFKDVAFSYPNRKTLFCFNGSFNESHIYWIKGKNGIGKTSLINLLMGLFGHEFEGLVKINGISLKELDYPYFIQRKFAIVEQDPYLLNDTFEHNISCKAANSVEATELLRLSELFGMEQFFQKQPQEPESVYQYQNDNLSGGEKQKTAVMRLLLSDADVWVMDEPTASMDQRSCVNFYEELERRKKGHIIILITHDIPLTYDEKISLDKYTF